jgi:rhomboid protease GluP
MRDGHVQLCEGLDDGDANRIVVLLASMGIESSVNLDGRGGLAVFVRPIDLDAARRLVGEEIRALETRERMVAAEPIAAPERWFGRGKTAVLAVAAANVVAFVVASRGDDAASRARLLAFGAIDRAHIEAGEYWRFVTAMFLHFDGGHLLANLAVLMFVGPPLAHLAGSWMFLLVVFVSGTGANVISHLVAPTLGLKAGASGAIAGVLGTLGGRALRPDQPRRRKAWQTLAALAAIYGLLVGFGPRSDHVAHLAGLGIGIALGRWVRSANAG